MIAIGFGRFLFWFSKPLYPEKRRDILERFGTFVFYHEVTLSSIEKAPFSWFHFWISEKYFSSFRQIMSNLLIKATSYNQI